MRARQASSVPPPGSVPRQLPQAVQAAVRFEGLGVGVRIGEVKVQSMYSAIRAGRRPQVRRDQQRVHRFAPFVGSRMTWKTRFPPVDRKSSSVSASIMGPPPFRRSARSPSTPASALRASLLRAAVVVFVHISCSFLLEDGAAFSPGLPCWAASSFQRVDASPSRGGFEVSSRASFIPGSPPGQSCQVCSASIFAARWVMERLLMLLPGFLECRQELPELPRPPAYPSKDRRHALPACWAFPAETVLGVGGSPC